MYQPSQQANQHDPDAGPYCIRYPDGDIRQRPGQQPERGAVTDDGPQGRPKPRKAVRKFHQCGASNLCHDGGHQKKILIHNRNVP